MCMDSQVPDFLNGLHSLFSSLQFITTLNYIGPHIFWYLASGSLIQDSYYFLVTYPHFPFFPLPLLFSGHSLFSSTTKSSKTTLCPPSHLSEKSFQQTKGLETQCWAAVCSAKQPHCMTPWTLKTTTTTTIWAFPFPLPTLIWLSFKWFPLPKSALPDHSYGSEKLWWDIHQNFFQFPQEKCVVSPFFS